MKKCLKRWLVPLFAAVLTVMAAIPALAAETVNVTVPNVKGGYLEVFYFDGDTTVYLPVGETVKVPANTSLRVRANQLDYSMTGMRIEGFLQSWSVNGEAQELPDYESEIMIVEADKDLTLSAVFKGHKHEFKGGSGESVEEYELAFDGAGSEYDNSTGMYSEGNLPSKQLTVVNRETGKKLGFSGATEIEITESWVDSGEYEDCSGLFRISDKGVLTANKPLKRGEYQVNLSFVYKGEPWVDNWLYIYVGSKVNVKIPLVQYESSVNAKYKSPRGVGWTEFSVEDANKETFQNIFDRYKKEPQKFALAGHEATGLGSYDGKTGQLKNIMSAKVKDLTNESDLEASVYLIYKGYSFPTVAHLDESDIVPKKVNPGWNQLGGKDYYYETDDPTSLVTNAWVDCKDKDGEQVWVGKDGTMVIDSVVKVGNDSYLVDAAGHKIKGKTTTKNGVEYTTDADGKITETKVHLASPSNAAEAASQVDRVLANKDTMTEADLAKAADMLTEALTKKKVDASKLTAAEIAKYEEVYKAAFTINVETDGAASTVSSGAILAAGITSADVKDGSVTIQYSSAWKASSSNAQERVLVQLFVNGKERTTLAAPIKITITEMPEAFIASYSNAKYNYEIADAKDVTLDTDKGVLTMTVSRTGIFNIKATLKPTKKPSGGGGGTYTSLGGGSRSVKTDGYKNGQWVRNDKGWWYKYEDGTWPANAWLYLPWKNEYKWYFFNAEGYMATGWLYWKDNYYYLYPYADGDCGYMFTGWHEIGGKWYYFYEQNDAGLGTMAYNTYTPDGYKVDASGAWIK